MKTFGFSKWERIRKKKEFLEITRIGQRRQTGHFIIYLKPNLEGHLRLGMTVSRQVGNAVKRNRVKRLLREFFRLHKKQLPARHDILIIAKKGAADLSYDQVCEELSKALCKYQ
ncbi:MAG: ribonuclease P protein component [Candidatus Desulfofervidaceae bacterium]|nr:ribonuclease P protein component [Candidatus Desulfofervidaceae bacterium]MDL1970540.1 ribonuclease P protein component [Candidatus Desulfofervidaceae bacterium]